MNFTSDAYESKLPNNSDTIFDESNGRLNPLKLYGDHIPKQCIKPIKVLEASIEIANFTWDYFDGDMERIQEMAESLERITIKIAEGGIETPSDHFQSEVMSMIPRNYATNKMEYEAVINATWLVQEPKGSSQFYVDPAYSLTENFHRLLEGHNVYREARKIIEVFATVVCSDQRRLSNYKNHLLFNVTINKFGQLDMLLCQDIKASMGLLSLGGEISNYLIGRQVANDMGIIFDFTDYQEDLVDKVNTGFIKKSMLGNLGCENNTVKLATLVSKQSNHSNGGIISTDPLD